MARIGVDVGGTFTDLILDTEDGGVFVHKVPSTPEDQSFGVITGVREICELADVSPGDIDLVFHGTTVATNAVLEYDGAEVGMVTTRGYRDILHMARHKRPHNFSMQFDVPWQSRPLVRRRNRIPVTERIIPPTGEIETALAENEVREAAKLFGGRGISSVIVCFLFSFLNRSHELRAKELIKDVLPDAYVSCSHEIADVLREYERFSTAAMNAFVGPRSAHYLRNLETALRDNGITGEIRVMQSNGGVTTIAGASVRPVTILMSGPAGGVMGGKWSGKMSGEPNIITVDIGGTSADISVIPEGAVRIMNPRDTQVGGYPVLVPMIDLSAIGAGGGSIAYVDEGGAFGVGPRSAGAVPGPACYGRGGNEPTVTDAQVVLGRLDPEHFLGGGISIDPALSRKAIEENLCPKLGLSVEDAALGIIRVINSNMAREIRANSVAKGIDPRNFSLMPFGGAGPLHGVALAKSVEARQVIVPPAPGINAAIGLLASDMQYEFTRSELCVLNTAGPKDFDRINAHLDELIEQARAALTKDGGPVAVQQFKRFAEFRYLGQGFELRAELPSEPLNDGNRQRALDAFHTVHARDYGHAFEDQMVEMITLRVIATAETKPLVWPPLEAGDGEEADALLYARSTIFDNEQTLDTPRYDRTLLTAGQVIDGPAIIVQRDSTTLVPPGYTLSVKGNGNMHVSEDASK